MSEFHSLGEMASAVNDKITVGKDPEKPYVGLENIKPSSGALNGHSASGFSISTNSVFERHDVLFGKLRPNLRKCVSAPFSGYCSTDILVLRPNEGFDPGYVAKTFQSNLVGRAAEGSAIGTKMPRTSWRDLKELEIFAPSLPEQRLIARILDTLDTQIQKTEALIAKLEKVKEGLLHDLLTRGIDENGQLRPSPEQASELYKESPLGLIPREWEYGSLEDVGLNLIDGDRGPNYPSDSELYSTDGFCLFLSAKNVTKTGFKFKESQFITKKKDSLLGKGKLQRDDTVITTRGTVGNFAHYNNSIPYDNIRINSGMLIIRNSGSKVSSSFAYIALKEHYFDIELRAKGSGSAQPQLPARDFKSFSLPAPGLEEQERITRAVEPLMLRIQSELEWLAELKSLKAGLMNDLLTGRVRVTPLLEKAQAATPA